MERKITQTCEFRVESEQEAQDLIKKFRDEGNEVIATKTTMKEKKLKGEVVDYGVLVSIKVRYGDFWMVE